MKADPSRKLSILVFIFISIFLTSCTAPPDAHWIEEIDQGDGHILSVRRGVQYTRDGGELSTILNWYPLYHTLIFQDPISKKDITWTGMKHVYPISLRFINDHLYLTVYGEVGSLHRQKAPYGCPEIPYAHLQYERSSKKWVPVAGNTVPDVARHANLTADLLSGLGHDRSNIPHHLDQNEVATINKRKASPNSYFSIIAPRSAEDWNYSQKGRYITSRYPDDCRPALSEPVDHIFPKGNDPTITPVDTEILDTKIFSPSWVIHRNSEEARLNWDNATYDTAGHEQCESLFKSINEDDARLDFWRAFALDPQKNRVTSVNYVVSAICHDDVIWFINYIKEPHRTVIVKTDASGEIFYKISFPTPDNIDNSSGAITQSTLHSEGGYVYFEWWNFHLPANKIVIVRKMKIRLAEPQTHGREKHN